MPLRRACPRKKKLQIQFSLLCPQANTSSSIRYVQEASPVSREHKVQLLDGLTQALVKTNNNNNNRKKLAERKKKKISQEHLSWAVVVQLDEISAVWWEPICVSI